MSVPVMATVVTAVTIVSVMVSVPIATEAESEAKRRKQRRSHNYRRGRVHSRGIIRGISITARIDVIPRRIARRAIAAIGNGRTEGGAHHNRRRGLLNGSTGQ